MGRPRETRWQRWSRRSISLLVLGLAATLVLGLTPVLLPILGLTDMLRGSRWATARAWLAFVVYLLSEVLGVIASAVLWLLRPCLGQSRYLAANHALQRLWTRGLFLAALRLFSMRVRVADEAVLFPGPFLLFVRHASIIDSLLAANFVSRPHGYRLRYVVKDELLWDPCLDIVGQRVPNVFIRRGTGESGREIEAIRELATDLAPNEGVLIYPEGTRFTPAKQASALARIGLADADRAGRLAGLRHTLPPRFGGPLGLIEARPDLDVVFLVHVGFEGVQTLNDLWNGSLIGREIRVAFQRVAATAIPSDRAGREAWLDAQWRAVDTWVDTQLTVGAAA